MFAATATELTEFKTLLRGLLVFRRRVVPALAITTLKDNIISRHNSTSFDFQSVLSVGQ
jgi:hypothetical protein